MELERLVPHRPPMLLLDRMLEISKVAATAEVRITPETMFFEKNLGGVPAWVGVEYMAQTVAAYSGHLHHDEGPAVGFLLGARKFNCEVTHFPSGSALQVKVEPVLIDQGLGSFRAKIEINGKTIADAMLTTYKPDEQMLTQLRNENSDEK